MKRRIAIILLLLVGGAVVNVAVAWGLCRSPLWREGHTRLSPEDGAERWWHASAPDEFPRDREITEVMQWKRFANRYWSVSTFIFHGNRFESGWPLYSLERSHWSHYSSSVSLEPRFDRDAFQLEPRLAELLGTKYLPLRPIWPGFAINTLFYALLLWLLFFTSFTARRMLRRRRGLCEKCAYPIGVSPVCTECGAAVAQALRPK